MFTFGQPPTFQSDEKFELDVSDDGEAWTLTFSDFVARAGGTDSPAPTTTHAFLLVMPLQGHAEGAEIDFNVQGFVLTTEGATATVVLSVNGQTTVADFPARSEQSFVQSLKFTAPSASECRLCVLLLVGRDSNNPDAEAFMNATAIDANIPSASAQT